MKDPRIPALLPLWDKVLKELEVEVRYIWIFRNPLEVMESLRRRDGYTRKHGLLLWIHYNLRILKFLQEKNYLLIHYQDILENPCVLEELGRLFDCDLDADRKRELEQIVKHGYCHSHYSYEDVWNTGNGLLAELYGTLLKNQEARADAAKWEEQYRKAAVPEKALSMDDEVLENIRCLDKKEIVIYGAGNCGRRAAEILQKLEITNYNFCDKDIQKHGKKLMNGSIFSMEEIEERKNLVVITAIEEKWARKEAEYTLSYIHGIRFLSFSVLEALGKGADGT